MFVQIKLKHLCIGIFFPMYLNSSCSHLHDDTGTDLKVASLSTNDAETPNDLLLLIGKDPVLSPEQFMLKFRANDRFNDWVRTHPSQMVKAIGFFPLNYSNKLTTELFTYWVDKSYNASESCIENDLKDSPLRDSAIEGMVNGLKADQLATAVAWAHEIKNDSKRHQLLESLATQ